MIINTIHISLYNDLKLSYGTELNVYYTSKTKLYLCEQLDYIREINGKYEHGMFYSYLLLFINKTTSLGVYHNCFSTISNRIYLNNKIELPLNNDKMVLNDTELYFPNINKQYIYKESFQ